MESCFEDWINRLPDALLSHILSFLSTKEAASTSVLSKRWRYILAFVPSLEFDDSVYLHPERRVQCPLKGVPNIPKSCRIFIGGKLMKLSTSFPDFVDRILDLQGKYPLNKLILKLVDTHDPVDPDSLPPWIHNVLVRGLLDLHLVVDGYNWRRHDSTLPSRIFLSETLVKLRLEVNGSNPVFDVENVHLPKLKTLHLEYIYFVKKNIGFSKLLSGCPVLEELILDNIVASLWGSFSVSVTTLKRLTFGGVATELDEDMTYSVSFDTPNLVYLAYTEVVADQYPKVRFDSLIEARIDLLKREHGFIADNEEVMVGNATDFIRGISNVQRLYLSANTLEVLTLCCQAIPIFINLTHLTIQSKPEVGWELLPGLLKNCPNLKTLVFRGLCLKALDRRGDVCLCDRKENVEDDINCLSSSLVKVLEIFINDDDKIEKQIEQVKNFLETMPHLELLVLYYDPSFEEDAKVSSQLQMLTEVASPKCKVQLIPSNLRVSS